MEADFGPYGIRRGSRGWQRSTSYHPYELRQGTAQEKVEVSASGTGKRLLEQANGHKREVAEKAAVGSATPRRTGGQARSPVERFAR